MSSVSRLVKRDHVFYFRCAVPLSLTDVLKLREVKFSLRTSDIRLAKIRARCLSNSVDLLFLELPRMQAIPAEKIHELARAYLTNALGQSLERAYLWPLDKENDVADLAATYADWAETKRARLAAGDFPDDVKRDAEEMLKSLDATGRPFTIETLYLAYSAVLRAQIEDNRMLAARFLGKSEDAVTRDPIFKGVEVYEMPPPGGEGVTHHSETSLRRTVEKFLAYNRDSWAPKTRGDYERLLELVLELTGQDHDIKAFGAAEVRAVRDCLSRLPPNYTKIKAYNGLSLKEIVAANKVGPYRAWKTQDKAFTLFRNFLGWCVAEDIITAMPGKGVKIAPQAALDVSGREPYSHQQLVKIFSSPIYRGSHSEARRATPGSLIIRDAKFWIPLIGLFTGMRLGEIMQLQVGDLGKEDGIHFFEVSRGGDKTLKTRSAERRVPLHPILLSAGVLHLIERANGRERLFWDMAKAKSGHYSGNFSKFWTGYGQACSFHGPQTPFHSFRHSFTTGLRNAEVSRDVQKALLGHADDDVTDGYGHGPNLKLLQKAIERLEFGIDFSHLRIVD